MSETDTPITDEAIRNGLLLELAEYQRTCRWTENDDGAYETSCGETFEFTDGGPKENKFKHCPYCGRRMENTMLNGASQESGHHE